MSILKIATMTSVFIVSFVLMSQSSSSVFLRVTVNGQDQDVLNVSKNDLKSFGAEGLQQVLAVMEQKLKDDEESLGRYRSENRFFCEKIKIYQQSCPLASRVIPYLYERELQCVESDNSVALEAQTMSVEISGNPQDRYQLLVRGQGRYLSQVFSAGAKVSLNFCHDRGAGQCVSSGTGLKPVRWMDVTEVTILPIEESISPEGKELKIFVGATPMLQESVIKQENTYRVSLDDLQISQHQACQLSEEDLYYQGQLGEGELLND